MRQVQKGFTLVEIAIVLVIIGLLLGGILKGQEMITQAKIKNIMSAFSGISAAYHGYQDRYRAIPGDDPGASTRWTTAPAAVQGDGNGVVTGTYNNGNAACATTVESCKFWDHLRRAGFVAGSGVNPPFNAVTGLIGVQTGDAQSPIGPVRGGAGGAGGLQRGGGRSAKKPKKIPNAVDT